MKFEFKYDGNLNFREMSNSTVRIIDLLKSLNEYTNVAK